MSLIKIAGKIIADYVYDPKHTEKPKDGGPWYKTDAGWSTIKGGEKGKDTSNEKIDENRFFTMSSDLAKAFGGENSSIEDFVGKSINLPKSTISAWLGSSINTESCSIVLNKDGSIDLNLVDDALELFNEKTKTGKTLTEIGQLGLSDMFKLFKDKYQVNYDIANITEEEKFKKINIAEENLAKSKREKKEKQQKEESSKKEKKENLKEEIKKVVKETIQETLENKKISPETLENEPAKEAPATFSPVSQEKPVSKESLEKRNEMKKLFGIMARNVKTNPDGSLDIEGALDLTNGFGYPAETKINQVNGRIYFDSKKQKELFQDIRFPKNGGENISPREIRYLRMTGENLPKDDKYSDVDNIETKEYLYRYDDNHQNMPEGSGWEKTKFGWKKRK